MPEVSRFFGIVIRMYFLDREPAHFHAAYSGFEAQIRIAPVGLMGGELPPHALAHERSAIHIAGLHQCGGPGQLNAVRLDGIARCSCQPTNLQAVYQ